MVNLIHLSLFSFSGDEEIEFKITSIDPGYGPRAGGQYLPNKRFSLRLISQSF